VGKGAATREAILEQGLQFACNVGLESVTLGKLADQMKMSKSGVNAHFGSLVALQFAIVKAYARKLDREVFQPSIGAPPGLPRLHHMLARWIMHVTSAEGREAMHINCAAEFDGAAVMIRDELVAIIRSCRNVLETCVLHAVDQGQLAAQTDHRQLAHELHGLIVLLHHDTRFLRHDDALTIAERGLFRLLGSLATPMGAS
jgi:AcrR family transcriptional regulator